MPDTYTRPQFAKLFKEYHPDAFPEGVKPEDYDEDELIDVALQTYPEYKDFVETKEGLELRRNQIWGTGPSLDGDPTTRSPQLQLRSGAANDLIPPTVTGKLPGLPEAFTNAAPTLATMGKGLLSGATAGASTRAAEALVPVEGPARDLIRKATLPSPGQERTFEAANIPGALATNLGLMWTMGPAGPAAYAATAETVRQSNLVDAGTQPEGLNYLGIAGQAALGAATAKAPAFLGKTLPQQALTGAAMGTLTGATPILTQQLTDTGTIDWNDPMLRKWALAGGLLGGALPAGLRPFRSLPDPSVPGPSPMGPEVPPNVNQPLGGTHYRTPDGGMNPATVVGPHAGPQAWPNAPLPDPAAPQPQPIRPTRPGQAALPPGPDAPPPPPPTDWTELPPEAGVNYKGQRVTAFKAGPMSGGGWDHPTSWSVRLEDGTVVDTDMGAPREVRETGAGGARTTYTQPAPPRGFGSQGDWVRTPQLAASTVGMASQFVPDDPDTEIDDWAKRLLLGVGVAAPAISIFKNRAGVPDAALRKRFTDRFVSSAHRFSPAIGDAAQWFAQKWPRVAAHMDVNPVAVSETSNPFVKSFSAQMHTPHGQVTRPMTMDVSTRGAKEAFEDPGRARNIVAHEGTHAAQALGNKQFGPLYEAGNILDGYRSNPPEIMARARGETAATGDFKVVQPLKEMLHPEAAKWAAKAISDRGGDPTGLDQPYWMGPRLALEVALDSMKTTADDRGLIESVLKNLRTGGPGYVADPAHPTGTRYQPHISPRFPDQKVPQTMNRLLKTAAQRADKGDPTQAAAANYVEQTLRQRGAWGDNTGSVPAELLPALTGALLGGATGAATGEDGDRWTRGVAGAVLGGLAGAGVSGAASALQPNRRGSIAGAYGHPKVGARLEPNSIRNMISNSFRAQVTRLKTEFGKTFETFHELKKQGATYAPAIDRFIRFNSTLYEIPQRIKLDLESVFNTLKDPSDYRHMQDIVRLRRDIELMSRPNSPRNAAGIPINPEKVDFVDPQTGQPVQGANMTLPEAQAALANLEQLAQQQAPQVLQAADQHRVLVQRVAQEMQAQGWADPATVAANPNYFPDYVMDHLFGELNIPAQPAPAIRPGKKGYTKFWTGIRGGSGTTLRSYIDVMARRLMEHYADVEKATLIRDLGTHYDPFLNGTMPGPRPAPGAQPLPGYDWYTFDRKATNRPLAQNAQGTTLTSQLSFMLPEALIRELHTRFTPVNEALKWANKWTGKFKGLVIKGQGPAFPIRNFLGDNANLYWSSPAWEWPKLAINELKAVGEMVKSQFPGGSQTLNRAQASGFGASAARAEVSEQVLQARSLRNIAQPQSKQDVMSAAQGAFGRMYNVIDDVWNRTSDTMREWAETIPRLTMFIDQIGKGKTDPEAGRITNFSMVDYGDLTPREKTWLRGLFAPFFTFQKKTIQNYIPFAGKDIKGSRMGQAKNAAMRTAQAAVIGGTSFALWNLQMYPDAERSLPEWLKDQPHVLLPSGWDEEKQEWKLFYLTLSGPANVAARSVGMGNAPTRAINVATGRSSAGVEWERSKKQMREIWMGQLGPVATVPAGLLFGKDLRTGRDMSPPEATAIEKAADRVTGTAFALPPLSIFFRAASEGRTSDEDSMAFLRRSILGSVAGRVDKPRQEAVAINRMFARARGDDADEQTRIRHDTLMSRDQLIGLLQKKDGPVPVPTIKLVQQIGPANALALYLAAKDGGEDSKAFAAGMVDVVREVMNDRATALAGTTSREDWEIPYRTMATIQNAQSMPFTAVPELAEEFSRHQKAGRPLFGKKP